MKTKRTSKNRAYDIHKIAYSPHCKGRIERVFTSLEAVVDCSLINESGKICRPRLNILIDEHSGKIIDFHVGERGEILIPNNN